MIDARAADDADDRLDHERCSVASGASLAP
jgi:hypothetical protein